MVLGAAIAFALVLPLAAQAAGKTLPSTVYVDPAAKCGGNTPCFRTIVKGIAGVATGGTVKVYPATYPEDVPIGKALTLTAATATRPTIDGSGVTSAVTVSAASVKIINMIVTGGIDGIRVGVGSFTLQGSDVTGNLNHGLNLQAGSGHNIGPGNLFKLNGGSGVFATGTSSSSIHDSTTDSNTLFGFNITSSSTFDVIQTTSSSNLKDGIKYFKVNTGSIVANTVFLNGQAGIRVIASNNILLDGNNCFGNTADGISFLEVDPSAITGNTVTGNGGMGVSVTSSQDITVDGNDILTNGDDGIGFFETDPSFISNNNIGSNGGDGVSVASSVDITVQGNDIHTNSGDGIGFLETDPSFVLDNMVSGNLGDGVDLVNSVEITVRGNTIQGNAFGLRYHLLSQSQTFFNNIIGNGVSLVLTSSPGNAWDNGCDPVTGGLGNFWSDYTGTDDGTTSGRCGDKKIAGDFVGDSSTGHNGVDSYPLLQPNGWVSILARKHFDGSRIEPQSTGDSSGNWVSTHIRIPKSSGYKAGDIALGSLLLAANTGFVAFDPAAPHSTDNGDGYTTLHAKFSRPAWLAKTYGGGFFCFAIQGAFNDGQEFYVHDCVTVK